MVGCGGLASDRDSCQGRISECKEMCGSLGRTSMAEAAGECTDHCRQAISKTCGVTAIAYGKELSRVRKAERASHADHSM